MYLFNDKKLVIMSDNLKDVISQLTGYMKPYSFRYDPSKQRASNSITDEFRRFGDEVAYAALTDPAVYTLAGLEKRQDTPGIRPQIPKPKPVNPLAEFMKTQAQIISRPSNELRSKIWSETYLAGLKAGNGIIVSSCDADAQLAKFDLLFTKTTPI